MSPLVIILLILFIFGGGIGYWGGPAYGTYGYSGSGTILLVLIAIWLTGGFKRTPP